MKPKKFLGLESVDSFASNPCCDQMFYFHLSECTIGFASMKTQYERRKKNVFEKQ